MKVKIKKTLNSKTIAEFDIEDRDFKVAMAQALPLAEPDYCGLCKNDKIIWKTNKAKSDGGEFIYVKRVCAKCGAQSTLGEYKGGGYFWKQWEIYQKKDNNQSEPLTTPQSEDITDASELLF